MNSPLRQMVEEWMVLHPHDSQGPTYDEDDLYELVVCAGLASYSAGARQGGHVDEIVLASCGVILSSEEAAKKDADTRDALAMLSIRLARLIRDTTRENLAALSEANDRLYRAANKIYGSKNPKN